MENKHVGWLIMGIAVVIGILVLIFNLTLKNIATASCTMGPDCTMYDTIEVQTWISLSIVAIVLITGIVIMFNKPKEKLIVKRVKPYTEAELSPKKFSKKSMENLNKEEAKIMNLLLENKGNIFQSQLSEKTGMNKVKITRILDSLEAQGLIERKRRGMTNVVVLK